MTTLVTFLLDRSSSMSVVRDSTITAFNAYVKGLAGDDITFSLVQFDSISVDTLYKNVLPSDVVPLDMTSYQPRGSTPLIDAAYKTIKAVERRVAELTPDTKVVICFQTDGQENCSRQHTWDELNDLIKEKTALGWQFNFMGVGLDAYQQAKLMGLSIGQTMSYGIHDAAQTAEAFTATASNTRGFASGALGSTGYTAKQKSLGGDKWEDAFKKMDAAGGPSQATLKPLVTEKPKRTIVDDIDL